VPDISKPTLKELAPIVVPSILQEKEFRVILEGKIKCKKSH
jgi:hypothetical protein